MYVQSFLFALVSFKNVPVKQNISLSRTHELKFYLEHLNLTSTKLNYLLLSKKLSTFTKSFKLVQSSKLIVFKSEIQDHDKSDIITINLQSNLLKNNNKMLINRIIQKKRRDN